MRPTDRRSGRIQRRAWGPTSACAGAGRPMPFASLPLSGQGLRKKEQRSNVDLRAEAMAKRENQGRADLVPMPAIARGAEAAVGGYLFALFGVQKPPQQRPFEDWTFIGPHPGCEQLSVIDRPKRPLSRSITHKIAKCVPVNWVSSITPVSVRFDLSRIVPCRSSPSTNSDVSRSSHRSKPKPSSVWHCKAAEFAVAAWAPTILNRKAEMRIAIMPGSLA